MDAVDFNELILRPIVLVCAVAAMVAVAAWVERKIGKDV